LAAYVAPASSAMAAAMLYSGTFRKARMHVHARPSHDESDNSSRKLGPETSLQGGTMSSQGRLSVEQRRSNLSLLKTFFTIKFLFQPSMQQTE
jgi:hypothetical protein